MDDPLAGRGHGLTRAQVRAADARVKAETKRASDGARPTHRRPAGKGGSRRR